MNKMNEMTSPPFSHRPAQEGAAAALFILSILFILSKTQFGPDEEGSPHPGRNCFARTVYASALRISSVRRGMISFRSPTIP
jgi:hypothetical protein